MDEYKPNSHAYKERMKKESEKKERVVGKVVNGVAKPRKRGEIRKLASIFIPEDVTNVKSYILMDVIVPYVKDAIEDVIHMLLRGESGGKRSRGVNASKISYRSYYDGGRDDRKRDAVSASRTIFDYEEILFDTRADAEAVLDAMNDIIAQYGVVSVSDLYDLAGVVTSNYMAVNYGWTDIFGCTPFRRRDGYTLKLPRPMPIR